MMKYRLQEDYQRNRNNSRFMSKRWNFQLTIIRITTTLMMIYWEYMKLLSNPNLWLFKLKIRSR
jgi:hypothetical protein